MKTQHQSIDALAQAIETLVQQHVAACHRAAQDALTRAFLASMQRAASGATHPRAGCHRQNKQTKVHRSPEALRALRARLFEAVCAHPGETMVALTAKVGESAKDLRFPMDQLRQTNRVRAVGRRHGTRYFPLEASSPQPA